MDNLGMWSVLSVAVFFGLTGQCKGRAKIILLWIFLWGQAGILSFITWRLYHSWQNVLASSYAYYYPQVTYTIFGSLMGIVLLLTLPVVWYYRDLRKAGGIKPPASSDTRSTFMKMQNETVVDGAQTEPGDELEDDLRPEYDQAPQGKSMRGKYLAEYRSGTNLVLLDADVAKAYPTAEAVNDALRRLMQAAQDRR